MVVSRNVAGVKDSVEKLGREVLCDKDSAFSDSSSDSSEECSSAEGSLGTHMPHMQGKDQNIIDYKPLYDALGVNESVYEKVMPLTSMQRDLYMDSVLNPETMQNSLGYAVKLHTEVDVDLWKEACQIVSDSQSILRTKVIRSYNHSFDFAYQCVKREHQIDFTYMDLSSKAMDDERLKGIVESEIYKKYDVDNDSLVNYVLIKIAPECFITILATHHIIMDGIGFASQLISVCQCYEALLDSKANPDSKAYEPLEDVFEEYVLFNNDTFDSEKVISFWKDMLKYVEPLDFHVAEEERERKPRKISKTVEVASDHWSNIQKYCRKNRITPAIYFKCLYGLLLKEYCRAETDFYIVELSAGRPKGHAAAIGCYFQQIPFVFPFELMKKSSTINDLFLYARDYQRSLKENRNLSISKQRQLLPHGRIGFMYNFIHFFPKLELLGKEEKINQYMNDVDGQVQFVPKVIDGSLYLNLYYHEGDFLDFDFLDRVVSLSKQLICGKEDFISLEFVSNDEIEKQLYTWNDTEVVREDISSMQQLIEQQVEKTPGLVALIFEDQKMTYSDLNARANQLAGYLRNRGVGKNSLVGLCADRSFEMVIGLLAIIKAGGAYVPIDPTYPRDRIRYIIDDSKVSIILTQGENSEVVKNKGVDYLEIDKSWGKISQFSEENLPHINDSSDLINVIYTSGSTGKPKGVMVPHSGIINRIMWMQEEYKLDKKDIVLQKTPYSFDVSVWEFFWPLMYGNKMVIAKPNGHKDPNYLADLIEKERITTLHFVPSMLAVFLYADEIEEKCRSLKRVFCSGEALSFEHERRFFDRIKNSELHNLYGPTEASIDVSYWQCLPDNKDFVLPIGKPIANTQLYILDNALKMLPIGVAGELFIGGAGLAHGYINKPELTEKKFVQNPFDKTGKSKLYKTGDLAKYREDGTIEFLGRVDFQVKIRGFRIELSEIEIVLKHYAGVEEAIVIPHEDASGDKKLVAYILTHDTESVNAKDLRLFLKKKLPDYMVPSAFFVMDDMPLTSNGKLDRKALLANQDLDRCSAEFTAPQTDTEKKLAKVWVDILNISRVGIYDNFFELGGHSLLATKLASTIKETCTIDIDLPTLFKMSSLKDLAAYIDVSVAALKGSRDDDKPQGNRVELEF